MKGDLVNFIRRVVVVDILIRGIRIILQFKSFRHERYVAGNDHSFHAPRSGALADFSRRS